MIQAQEPGLSVCLCGVEGKLWRNKNKYYLRITGQNAEYHLFGGLCPKDICPP